MTRSDEAQAFFHAVYSAVQEIPAGHVTSYGHIAKLIGTREYPRTYFIPYISPCIFSLPLRALTSPPNLAQRPRQVGVCLKHLPADPASRFNNVTVPWQRVISAKGIISPRSHPTGATSQATKLRQEGVTVTQEAMGQLLVSFGNFGWFPGVLPSEADMNEGSSDEDET